MSRRTLKLKQKENESESSLSVEDRKKLPYVSTVCGDPNTRGSSVGTRFVFLFFAKNLFYYLLFLDSNMNEENMKLRPKN